MRFKDLCVSKISFKCKLNDYYGIIFAENNRIICAANVSNCMKIDGLSVIFKNRISKISSCGKENILLSRVHKERSTIFKSNSDLRNITFTKKLRDIFKKIPGIVGIDFLYPSNNKIETCYSFGYVEDVQTKFVDIRFVDPKGRIDWDSLDRVLVSDIVKIEWNSEYTTGFQLLNKKINTYNVAKMRNKKID